MSNENMISAMIESGALYSKRVIDAFKKVDRKDFVKKEYLDDAYADAPLPLSEPASFTRSTISQPSTVAAMTEALYVKKGMKVLEVGTGSGYQAALLSVLVGKSGKIITTEIENNIYEFAKKNLENYRNVIVMAAGTTLGCKEEAPYDRIIVTASAEKVPEKLLNQLKVGGIMVIPVKNEMFKIIKNKDGIIKEFIGYYAFVKLKED